jgi:ParB family chromosome partitioning protein
MRHSFGRGIESLIPNKKQKNIEKPTGKKEAVFYIEVEKIKSNPYQPRKQFDAEALDSLAESIQEYGVLQPLIATKVESSDPKGKNIWTEYQLIAGERRLMAAKMAGLREVPVIIRKPNEKEKLEISLIENIQRLDLNPIEKAEAFERLHEEFGMTHEKIGELAGLARPAVSNALRLLDLSEEIKQAIKEGKINEGQAKAILLVKEPQKRNIVFQKILRDGLNVREVEFFAKKLNVWKPSKTNLKTEFSDELGGLEIKLKELFGVTAKTINLKLEQGRPKLTIFFDSRYQVEKIIKELEKSRTLSG